MPPAPLPSNESQRLAALRSYEILDTACEDAFDEIAWMAAAITGRPMALVSLVDGERQWFKARYGLAVSETPREHAFCGYAILGDGPLLVADATRDPRFSDNPLVTGPPGLRAYAGMPLVNPEGYRLGTLCVLDRAPGELSGVQRQHLAGLARTVVTTLELHRAMRRVRRLALTDGLTGLANRPGMMDALQRAIARQRRQDVGFTLVYLDLDGFKAVNDRHGHAAGDAVLREVAAVLQELVRRDDLPARLGGDEFAVLMENAQRAGGAEAAERLRAGLAGRLAATGVTASVGAVQFLEPPPDADAALSRADTLMYLAKQAGKDRVCFATVRPGVVEPGAVGPHGRGPA
jgi:diguanylate cyclase (GGDEF)-like protein